MAAEPGRHALIVAFYWPPARASGLFRPRALANHLVARGWSVTVLAAGETFFTDVLQQSDPTLNATVDGRVRVVRVPFDDPRFERGLRHHGWFRGNFPRVAERRMQRRTEAIFPDPYARWIRPAVKAARSEVEGAPDVVVATGNPFSSFEVARDLAAAWGCPAVLDYRDGWTLDQFGATAAYPPDAPQWGAEARVLEAADRVVFVNSRQAEWYADRYPLVAPRMRVVENGYDPDLLGPLDGRASDTSDGPLRFGYVGTITRHLPWSALYEGWRQARSTGELADAQLELYGYLGFFSHSEAGIAALIDGDEADGISYHGPVPKERVAAVYEALDVLLLVTPGSPFVTCQKVYEYMAFGKPIVSVNDPGTHARVPLQGYPLEFSPPSLEPDEIARQLLAAAAAARSSGDRVAEARRFATRFERSEVLRGFEDLLTELTDA